MRIAIIGGGITGLAAAYYLRQRYTPQQLSITLFEKELNLGGTIQTIRRDGFMIEEGPESFVRYKPFILELCQSLGIENQLVEPNPEHRKTFIYHQKKLVPLPDGIFSIFSQPLSTIVRTLLKSPLFSLRGKLRLALEPFILSKRDDTDESIGSFIERRLGKEFLENLLEPLLSGVYGTNAREFSVKSLLREYQQSEIKYGSLFRAALVRSLTSKSSLNGSQNKGVFLTFQNGLSTLIETLVSKLTESCTLLTGVEIETITPNQAGYSIALKDQSTSVKVENIVLATPAYTSAKLLKQINPLIARELETIPYSSATVLSFGFSSDSLTSRPEGYGFLASPKENLPILACTWSSNKWKKRAPEAHHLMRAYVPQNFYPGLENEVLLALHPMLGFKQKPVLALVHEHRNALPRYLVGHQGKIEKINQMLTQHPGLFLAGSSLNGVGIPDCIRSAHLAIESLLSTAAL